MGMTVLRGSLRGVRPIESQVELQDVDARSAPMIAPE